MGVQEKSDPTIRVGIVTISDRVSAGERIDLGGPAVEGFLRGVLRGPWQAVSRTVSDDREALENLFRELCEEVGCCLVVTTGGTGPAPRDNTPEALAAVCGRLLPGFGERMRAISMPKKPTAMLSRQLAGVLGSSLIVALPGNPAAIRECLEAVFPAIPHCLDLIGGPHLKTRKGAAQDAPHE